MSTKEFVVVFGKEARPGKVKTRLTPDLSADEAAELYSAFAKDVMASVDRYCRARQDELGGAQVGRVLAWDGDHEAPLATHAKELGFSIVDQGPRDLGHRLRRVFGTLRQRGGEHIVAVPTDTPTLSPSHIRKGRRRLDSQDVVFGPAFDGGYYLLGIGAPEDKKPPEQVLFEEGIDWRSHTVLEDCWRRSVDAEYDTCLLEFWYDIDVVDDLEKTRFHLFDFLNHDNSEVGANTRAVLEERALV